MGPIILEPSASADPSCMSREGRDPQPQLGGDSAEMADQGPALSTGQGAPRTLRGALTLHGGEVRVQARGKRVALLLPR